MTQEELNEKLAEFIAGLYKLGYDDAIYNAHTEILSKNYILRSIIKQYVKDVIGGDTVGDQLNNMLRAEQRKRAGL